MHAPLAGPRAVRFIAVLSLVAHPAVGVPQDPMTLGDDRVVLQTKWGEIELGFYENAAPETSKHMLSLFRMGAYNSVSFFRLEAGFVTQVEEVVTGRQVPLHVLQAAEAKRTVPFEVDESAPLKHVAGSLSMVHPSDDRNGGTSSFCIMLGEASHLDGQYSVFGKVTRGWDTLRKIEKVPHSHSPDEDSGFMYPKEQITILSTFVYRPSLDLGIGHVRDAFNTDDTPPLLAAIQRVPTLHFVLGAAGAVLLFVTRWSARKATGSDKDQDV